MKKTMLILFGFLSLLVSGFSSASSVGWGGYGNSPQEVLDRVVGESNKKIEIQETALDSVEDSGGYRAEYKISNTLDWLRVNIAPYLQWLVYIGLTVAVILIIYNGFLMVTHSVHKEGDMTKVKKNISYIMIGVLILTGFYSIIKLVIGIINSVFGTSNSGDTGF